MVNTSLKKLKHHLANFDVVVKERTTPTAITEGSWGFEHTKACFRDEIIPFVKALKDLFRHSNQHLVDELYEVQNVSSNGNRLVTMLIAEIRAFEQTFKQLYDSIKKQVFASEETIDPELHQVNVEQNPQIVDKRTAHSAVYYAFSGRSAEMLSKISKTCPSINNSGEQLVAGGPYWSDLHFSRMWCPLTRITTTTEVPLRKSYALDNKTPKPVVTLVYSRKPRKSKTSVPVNNYKVVQIVLWYLDSGCSKHMTGDRSQLTNFVNKFLGTLMDWAYLFSVGQFCDSNLEVAFRQHTCYIRNLEGVDLLTGSRGDNLYTLSLGDMMASSPICLLSKASKTKSWLWHRRLSHLNFGAINHLSRHGLVRGLPKLKFEKDHLCSACALGKSTKKPHKPKSEDTNQEKLYLLHMDLCGPMRVTSVNGKKYILVIVDDYSRFTWVKCLRSKDEAPAFIINFLKMIQVRLKETVRRIRTDNGTEFVNQTLHEYYENVGISHETSVALSPQQNGVVGKGRNSLRLIEAASLC
ncbi:retrovirus-related pol polyprotein from transposon TNT 1-94 [Tanacetum coccineum]